MPAEISSSSALVNPTALEENGGSWWGDQGNINKDFHSFSGSAPGYLVKELRHSQTMSVRQAKCRGSSFFVEFWMVRWKENERHNALVIAIKRYMPSTTTFAFDSGTIAGSWRPKSG